MECSRDSGNCWEKDLPRSQATGFYGGAWLPAERVPPAPQGAAMGGPVARPDRAAHPRGIPGCGAGRSPGPAHLPCSRGPAAGAWLRSLPRPAWHEESAGRGNSRAGASPPPRGCSPAGAMRNRSGPSGITENLNPGLSHPCLRLPLQACLFPLDRAALSPARGESQPGRASRSGRAGGD